MPYPCHAFAAALALAALPFAAAAQSVQVPKDVASLAAHGALTQPARPVDTLFPVATEDLVITWGADGVAPSMLELLGEYGRITGQQVLFDEENRAALGALRVPVDRPTQVPAAHVQNVLEALLVASGCVLTIERADAPRLVQVITMRSVARQLVRGRAQNYPSDRTDLFRAHPAMLFTTVIDVPNSDARVVVNSLRTLITDTTTMNLIPAGNASSIIATGHGPALADLVDQLRQVDQASARTTAPAVEFELVRLQFAVAAELAPIATQALSLARDQRAALIAQQQNPGAPQPSRGASLVADPRTNSLLVSGTAAEVAEAKRVIALLDVK